MPGVYTACRRKDITSHVIERRPAKPHYAIDRAHGSALMHTDPNVVTTRDRRTMAEQMDTHFLRRGSVGSVRGCSRAPLGQRPARGDGTPQTKNKKIEGGEGDQNFFKI